jgi:predicted amidohydrolase YtcJ
LAILAVGLPKRSANADGLIDNVSGYTVDAADQLRRFNAVIIRTDGRVGQLLLARDKRPKGLDWRYDAQGKTMLPGIVDAEGDLISYGLQLTGLDMTSAHKLADVQALIRAYAQTHRDKKWLIGRGWDHVLYAEGEVRSAAVLDAAVADRPVLLLSADGYAGWANSAALKAASLTVPPLTQDSVIAGPAMDAMMRVLPEPLPVERDQALAEAQYRLLAAGVTTMTDLGTSERDWNSFRRAADAGRLKLRIISYAENIEGLISIAGARPMAWVQDARLRMIGLGLQLDGSLQSGSAWRKPLPNTPASLLGQRQIDDTRLRNSISRAAMDGFQVALVAHGDAAVEEALNVIAEMVPTYTGDRRWRIHGISQIGLADQARLGRNGIVVINPSATIDGKIAPVWGSSVPLASPDPVAALLALRQPNGPQPFDDARFLASFTSEPAYAAFSERDFGRLLPGYHADFILLDGDPLASITAGHPIQVVETWIGGKREWSRK